MDRKSKRELLFFLTKKDFSVTYFSGSGAGGQHRNKHQNCVRIKHLESGVTSIGQNERSRVANLRSAFNRLVGNPFFRAWLSLKAREIISNKTLAEKVSEMMSPENLKVEYKINGVWTER